MDNAKQRRAWLGRVLAAASFVLLAGCATRPELRVGTSGDYPPFSLGTGSAPVRGFDIAVAERFAADSGANLVLVPFRWPELMADLERDTFAVAMSGVTVRADRALQVRFSRPYAVTGAVVVVRHERAPQLAEMRAVDQPTVRLAVNRGGHLERVTRAHFRRAQITTVDDNTQLVAQLLSGSVDAVVSESLEASTWPQADIIVLPPFTRDRKAYAATPRHAEELSRLDDWLWAREQDGWLFRQRQQWLGASGQLTARQACWEAMAMAIDVRLQLMPWVAAAKRAAGLAIDDAAQEERVLVAVRSEAESLGLDAEAAVVLFRDLIDAAKRVQHKAAEVEVEPAADLDQLRAAIGYESTRLLRETQRCRGELAGAGDAAADDLARTLAAGVTLLGAAEVEPAALASQLRALARPTKPADTF